VEDADRVLEPESFDYIISRGVLLEIHECDRAFRVMDKLLRRNGTMVHKAPCLDWMFPQNGHHPLEFLTISEPVYKMMTGDSGKCNRRMIDYYRRTVAALGYEATFHITKVIRGGNSGTGSGTPPAFTSSVSAALR
jgi:hypothetical protein